MLTDGIPLNAHPAFRAADPDALSQAVGMHLGAKIAKLPNDGRPFEACANTFKLPNSSLWFCSYGMPVALQFPEPDHVRVQFHHAGIGASWVAGALIPVNPGQGCISAGPAEIDFGPDFQQVVWRLPKAVLVRKLAILMDRAVTSGVDFDPVLRLDTPSAATLLRILGCLLHAADNAMPDAASAIVLGELEQALITAFLAATRHSCRDGLERKSAGAAPWQVRRAESHVEAHWNRPISIEELAAVTGASPRSLFRAFRQSRGYSPLEFARRIRLDHARRMLERPDGATSVTDVAFACGFNDLGRFSKDFVQAFGELPSLVLARSRRTHPALH